jgi:hypothetical protein
MEGIIAVLIRISRKKISGVASGIYAMRDGPINRLVPPR